CAREVLARGLAVSTSGVAFRTGEEATFEAVVPSVPAERLLVETDAPYLSPPGAPRRRNEPEWVRLTAQAVADARRPGAEAGPTFREALGEALVATYDATFRRAS
ncbi:MAG TPA: TatD family hydrolase, partial [Candidatus Binatus sp.]|nr:TatD family hydrolase [Candidatus Binatus sp.]